jgi:tRNA(fMet)-specific endonuclease VapC
MSDYLLDTNHVIHLLDGMEKLREQFRIIPKDDQKFGISVTVLGELYFAVYASRRRDENYRALQGFLPSMVIWPFEEAAAEEFGLILAEQKAKGRPIPPMDAQIAAVARLHGLTVLTADHHFRFVERLAVENWLV